MAPLAAHLTYRVDNGLGNLIMKLLLCYAFAASSIPTTSLPRLVPANVHPYYIPPRLDGPTPTCSPTPPLAPPPPCASQLPLTAQDSEDALEG
jgi:hypothetical protein